MGDRRSRFSSWGTCVGIFAPGSSIKSAGHRSDTAERSLSGTSMACPHVAGAAALLWGTDPTKTRKNVEDALLEYASQGKVQDARRGSPNKLLYVGAPATPAPSPKPT